MSTLNLGKNVTLEIGDFIVIAWGNRLEYGWYCGQGKDKSRLQYYGIWSPGSILEDFEKYEKGEAIGSWRAEQFRNKGFSSKCFYKSYITSLNCDRILRVGNPDELFTNPEQLAKYNKSKEALIKVKFLNQ